MGGWSNAWGTYPTVTMDKDLDVAWTFETFGSNTNSYPNWYIAKGFAPPGASYISPPLLGYGIENSAASGGAFTGQTSCNGSNPQPRWGDYVSTVWDPNFSSPSGENGAFWTVQEYTTGGSNQSTNWQALADPLPWFVGYSPAESECAGGTGSNCKITVAPPSGVQPGDVLLVPIGMGQTSSTLPTLPSGWTLLPAANLSGAQQITSQDKCGVAISSWLAAHVYGLNGTEPSSYSFTHYDKGDDDSCNGTLYGAEMVAFAVAYRGAGTNLSSYTAYGFTQDKDQNTFSMSAVSPPSADGELTTIFFGPSPESPESSEYSDVSFAAPAGSPTLSPETPLSNAPPYLAADVGIISGNNASFGPYSTSVSTSCANLVGCLWFAWQVAVPE